MNEDKSRKSVRAKLHEEPSLETFNENSSASKKRRSAQSNKLSVSSVSNRLSDEENDENVRNQKIFNSFRKIHPFLRFRSDLILKTITIPKMSELERYSIDCRIQQTPIGSEK